VRRLDRRIAVVSVALGILLLLISVFADLDGDDRGRLVFVAIDWILFSTIAALHPRSDDELKHDAREFAKFALLALAILGFITVSSYLLAGTPSPVPEELFVIVLAFGLPAALVLPPVLRRLAARRREQKLSK
jgi:hypothetical protein